jgi:phosphoglycerate dehydrogenase-like enzyme
MTSERGTVALRLAARQYQPIPSLEERWRQAHPAVTVEFFATEEAWVGALADADAAFGMFGAAPDSPLFETMRQAPHLRWVHHAAAGVDGVPLDALPPQVVVTSGKGPMAVSVAEHAVSLMLALARHLPEAVRDQQAQHWRPGGGLAFVDRVHDLHGRTVLILGVGTTGGELARICKRGFAMRVVGFARTRRDHPHVDAYVDRAGLPMALGEADFVCVALALTRETFHLVDAAVLAAMKPTASLINVARGEIVDEHALVAALQEHRIAGAGLDSFEVEPLPAEHPLWRLPNVLITPHRAAGSDGFWAHYADFLAENIRRFAESAPLLGVVDRASGY